MNESLPTDQELVAAAIEDQTQFGGIIDRYEDPLLRYIQRLGVKNKEDQEDVLQEIFVKVYRYITTYDPTLKFSSWIYRIAHNEAISWFRKKNVRPEGHLIGNSDEILSFLSSRENFPDEIVDNKINATAVNKALSQLEEKYRTVLILRFFEYKEYEEISDILKIPIGSVGTLIHRGKKQLKKIIATEQISL